MFFRGWFKEKSIIIIVGFCARCYRFDFHYVPLKWRNGDRLLITITPTCFKCGERCIKGLQEKDYDLSVWSQEASYYALFCKQIIRDKRLL